MYSREVNGEVLDFGVSGKLITNEAVLTFEVEEGLTLIDQETGSAWDGLRGEAIEGSMKGERLRRLKSTSSFWFGWKDFYPDTQVYGELLEDG